jgi:hypothetical protein
VIAYRDGQRTMQARQPGRDQPQYFRRDLVPGQFHEVGPERGGDDLIKAAMIDEPAIDQRLLDVFAVQLRLLQNVFDLRRLEHPLLHENFGNLSRVHERKPPTLIVGRFCETPCRRVASDTDALQKLSLELIDISQGYRDHFFRRGQPGENFANAVFTQRPHPQLAGALAQHQG